jgi:MioC protein
MAQILILIGTESGNAQMVGEAVAEELQRMGHTTQLANSGDCDTLEVASREVVLVCTSTHGDGEYPDNIIPLVDSLETRRPDLSGATPRTSSSARPVAVSMRCWPAWARRR